MARLIWAEPALDDLNDVAEYIALDNPIAASKLVTKVFESVERLVSYPNSGKTVPEMPGTPYRELIVPPCRIFYRHDKNSIYILYIMRGERLFREFLLKERNANR